MTETHGSLPVRRGRVRGPRPRRLSGTVIALAASGGPGSSLAGVVVAKENFRFTKGDDVVTRYESDFAPRNFAHCGSSLYDDLGDNYFVAAGLMRDLDLDPSFHLQVAYKAGWHEIGGDAPQFAENPPA